MMNLEDVDEKLAKKDFYGKVIERSEEKGFSHLVRFTLIPPAVNAYFQAPLKYVVKLQSKESS